MKYSSSIKYINYIFFINIPCEMNKIRIKITSNIVQLNKSHDKRNNIICLIVFKNK
jgi:hypothetical protein